jgi:hypothetical protein
VDPPVLLVRRHDRRQRPVRHDRRLLVRPPVTRLRPVALLPRLVVRRLRHGHHHRGRHHLAPLAAEAAE